MIYYEDINIVNEFQLNKCKFHIDINQYKDQNGFYWRITISEIDLKHIVPKYPICSVDTLEEAKIWCDLHNLKIKNIIEFND